MSVSERWPGAVRRRRPAPGGRQTNEPRPAGIVALRTGAVAVLLIIVGTVLWRGGFYGTLAEDILVFGIAAMGLDFLGGYGGLVSLGQAGWVGLGAYGVAVGEAHQFGAWESIGLALGVVIVVALATGVIAVRMSGIGFVIITLALSQILWGLAYRWVSVSGGDNGLPISIEPKLGPFDFSDPRTLAMAILLIFVVSAVLLRLFVSSPFGLSLQGIKSNERRLKTLGYATGLHRYLGYLISVFFGGIAGILYGFSNSLISPTAMDFSHNGIITVMAVVGGLGTLWGPVLGTTVIVLLQQDLSLYFVRWQSVMGALFVLIVVFAPDGLWGLLRQVSARASALARRNKAAVPVPAQDAIESAVTSSSSPAQSEGELL